VEDVAAGQAEALLELLGTQHQPVDDPVGQTRAHLRKASDRRVGRRVGVHVHRERLAEQRRDVVALRYRQRRIGRGLAGRFDPRRGGGAAGARVIRRPLQVVEREADVDRPVPRLLARPRGEVGKVLQQQHDLDHRPLLPPAGGRIDAGQPRGADRIRVREDDARMHLLPICECDESGLDPGDFRAEVDPRACRLRGRAQRAADGPHAAAREAPRAGTAGRLSQLVVEGDECGSGVVGAGQRPDRALQRERHPHLLGGDAGQLVGHRAVQDPLADRLEPARTVVGLQHQRPRPLGGRLPVARPLRVALGVRTRPVRLQLRTRARGVRPRDDLAPVRQRGEKVRLVRPDVQAVPEQLEVADDLPPQQRHRVGGRRGPHAWPQLLGHARPTGDLPPLVDVDGQAGAGQVRGSHEAVVPGPDDYRIHVAVVLRAGQAREPTTENSSTILALNGRSSGLRLVIKPFSTWTACPFFS
jgi:hypothetical protein